MCLNVEVFAIYLECAERWRLLYTELGPHFHSFYDYEHSQNTLRSAFACNHGIDCYGGKGVSKQIEITYNSIVLSPQT